MEINFATGWKKHPGIPGAFHLQYQDDVVGASIVTGPRGSGLMAVNDPDRGVTLYEAWFDGMQDPMGYLTLEEIQGIVKYIHERRREDQMYKEIEVSKN